MKESKFKNLSDILGKIGPNNDSSCRNYKSPANYTKQDKFSRGALAGDAFDFIQLMRKWETIVGKKLSTNTLPLKIQKNTLIIISSHSIYNSQLACFEKDILQKIKSSFPNQFKGLTRLSFKASQYFEDIKNQQIKQQTNFEQINTQKQEIVKGHKFDPEYQRKYHEVKVELGFTQESNDDELEDALINFNLKFSPNKK